MGGRIATFRSQRPVAYFVIVFSALLVVTQLLHQLIVSNTSFFAAYLRLNATFTGALLRFLGEDVQAVGMTLISGEFHLQVLEGCDAIRPTEIFICAVLASPGSWKTTRWASLTTRRNPIRPSLGNEKVPRACPRSCGWILRAFS